MQNKDFYNYAKLELQNIENYDMIIFYWESGSGKSSYINYIQSIQQQKYTIIDEILSWRDIFFHLKVLIFSSKKILLASHIPKKYYSFFRILWKKILFINLEKYPSKIEKYLDNLWYSYSLGVLHAYCDVFRATYLDIDIILESNDDGLKDFDIIYRTFMKHHRVKLSIE